jgi:hypothetical protein
MLQTVLPVKSSIVLKSLPTNRRVAVRWSAAPATPSKVFVAATYDTIYGNVLDISVGGIGLLLSRSLEIDTLVLIAVESPTERECFEMLARVARLTPQRDGTWIVGCSFYSDLTDDELEVLL